MYDKMTEAIKKVQESTKTQTAELQTKLDTVTKAENDKIAATWKDCLNKLDTAIKDGKWSEISTIISNYHAAANTIHAEFKPAKDALNKEIANLKTKEKQAIQDIRKSFMNQIYQLPRQNPWNWGGEFKDPGRKYITTK
jgi:archaellum component FlaC